MKKRVLRELEEELRQEGIGSVAIAEPESPPKRKPGRPKVEQPASVLPFDPMVFAEAVGLAIAKSIPDIAKAMKESNVDPEKEAIKKMRRQQMRETQSEARKGEVDKWLSCSHMRTHPYSGTARIGWAQQSDGLIRGTCMGCGCPFTPVESELPDPVRMKGMYEKYRAVPVSIAHNDFTSGMVVAGNPA